MKKVITKIAVLLLLVALSLSAVACGGKEWSEKDVTVKNWGAVKSETNGGFLAETENNVYFINGVGDAEGENNFGKPIKGSLVALEKNNPSNYCIVVPKLFVAQDYTAGILIRGDYVYYATPSTQKNSSGDIAKTDVQFMRTKLDGTKTDTFVTASGLDSKYRFVEVGDAVYIVYYDTATTSIISYNTETKKSITVAKTDIKAEKESLDSYIFVENQSAKELTVLYTTTIYNVAYDEEDAKSEEYTRSSEKYNKLYGYKAGDGEAKLLLDGSGSNYKYNVTATKGGYVFYTETPANENEITLAKTYAIKASDLMQGNLSSATEIRNTADINTIVMVSLEKAYVTSADSGFIKEISLLNNDAGKTVVKAISAPTSLLFVDGDYLYFYNSESYISRLNLTKGEDAFEERISDQTAATDWYTPEIAGGYIYFSDNSAYGESYIKRAKVNTVDTDFAEEKDDDGKLTLRYLKEENISLIAKMTDNDVATLADKYITDVTSNGKIVFDTEKDGAYKLDEEGKPYQDALIKAEKVYKALDSEQVKLVPAESVEAIKNYIEAYKLSRAFYGCFEFDKSDVKEIKDNFREGYNSAKSALEALNNSGFDVLKIRELVAERMNYFYQEADNYFSGK